MSGAGPLDLEGRAVLVTGASSGIGRETAILLSSLNARLVLAGRDRERLDATLAGLAGSGHRTERFDLAALDEIGPWLKQLCAGTGPLHGLVHCAGVHGVAPLQAQSAKGLEEILRINVSSALLLAKAFRQRGCCARDSSIVFMSSAAGLAGAPATSAYSASKAAVCGLTRSLAVELARERIRVNCIAAGFVMTEMTAPIRQALSEDQFRAIEQMHPLGLGSARDVANSIAFLIADTGRWITGSTLVVDGGYTAH